jgi:hypothetical protein
VTTEAEFERERERMRRALRAAVEGAVDRFLGANRNPYRPDCLPADAAGWDWGWRRADRLLESRFEEAVQRWMAA